MSESRLDSNGYSESILDTEQGIDYILFKVMEYPEEDCHCQTVRHEIYYGLANREMAKANGFWVNISPETHEHIHSKTKFGKEVDAYLKAHCEEVYLMNHTEDEFIELVGRRYT